MNTMNISYDKTIVFPYGAEFAPLLDGLLRNNQVGKGICLLAPKGWGISGVDAGTAFGRPPFGIIIKQDFEDAFHSAQTFIVAPFRKTNDIKADKEVEEEIQKYLLLAKNEGIKVIDLRERAGITEKQFSRELSEKDENKNNIEVPVIFVSGTSELVCKLDVQIKVGDHLHKQGYHVAHIGSRQYCDIIGMHPFPKFMFEPLIETRKIECFKKYVSNICKKEKPDALIIGIPGASVKFNNDIPNGYGVINFLCAMAVTPDFSFVCTPYGVWNFGELYEHRFGYPIGCCMVSNTKIRYDPIEHENELLFETLDHEMTGSLIRQYGKESSDPHFDLFDDQAMEQAVALLIEKLGNEDYFAI